MLTILLAHVAYFTAPSFPHPPDNLPLRVVIMTNTRAHGAPCAARSLGVLVLVDYHAYAFYIHPRFGYTPNEGNGKTNLDDEHEPNQTRPEAVMHRQ